MSYIQTLKCDNEDCEQVADDDSEGWLALGDVAWTLGFFGKSGKLGVTHDERICPTLHFCTPECAATWFQDKLDAAEENNNQNKSNTTCQ